MKTRWLVLVVIMVALGVAGAIGPRIWSWATTTRRWQLSSGALFVAKRGEALIIAEPTMHCDVRRPDTSHQVYWYLKSGLLAGETDGVYLMTAYNPDGSVMGQVQENELLEAPPWLNGVTDQTTPTAPWIAQGITASEFWEQVKEPAEPTLEEFVAGR